MPHFYLICPWIPLRLIQQNLKEVYYFSLSSECLPPLLIITLANIMCEHRINMLFLELYMYYIVLSNEME